MENEALSDYENGLRIFARMIARAYRQELAENKAAGSGLTNSLKQGIEPVNQEGRQLILAEEKHEFKPEKAKAIRKKAVKKSLKTAGGNHG